MGVHIHTRSFGLFQELFHVLEIMTGDKGSRVASDTDIDLGDFRISIGGCVCLVKKGHSTDCELSSPHDHRHHLVNGQVFCCGGKGFHQEIIYLFILVT